MGHQPPEPLDQPQVTLRSEVSAPMAMLAACGSIALIIGMFALQPAVVLTGGAMITLARVVVAAAGDDRPMKPLKPKGPPDFRTVPWKKR